MRCVQKDVSEKSIEQDQLLVEQLQAGDETAFAGLVRRWTPAMIRVAAGYVPNRQIAEEVVQDAWLAVVRAIGQFDGRSSLRTWVFVIVVRRAQLTGKRERRSLPFTQVWRDEHAPAVDPSRFHPANAAPHARGWISPPPRWDLLPDERLHGAEVQTLVEAAIADLPRRQGQVMLARDVWGCDASDVCRVLAITDNYQRVLLHRARAKVRRTLEATLGHETDGASS